MTKKTVYSAFANCNSFTSVPIPASVTNIGISAFYYCASLISINVQTNNMNYASVGGVLFNKSPTSLIQYPGGSSGAYTIPDSVTTIGDHAFANCNFFTSVTIPGSVTSISTSAFDGCDSLISINVQTNNMNYASVGGVLFNRSLTSLIRYPCGLSGAYTIPDSVTVIGDFAFNSCTSLTSVNIPGSVTSIARWAFSYCNSLSSVTIPNSVTAIGGYAFHGCISLTSITIPGSVTDIGFYAFYTCTSLTSVTIPGSVTTIRDGTSYDCHSLASVTIPNSVTFIGYKAFCRCNSLAFVTIPNSITSIGGYAFADCTSLVSVTIPASVASIVSYAFRNCTKLSSILFKSQPPTSVGTYVFDSTPATLYYLPAFAAAWPSILAGRPTLCWNPTVQHDASFGFASERFGLNIAGTTNIPVVVEATTNLASGVWTSLTNTTLGTSGSLYFADPSSPSSPSRFYRIVFP